MSLINNDSGLQFYWPGLSPPLTGGEYSILFTLLLIRNPEIVSWVLPVAFKQPIAPDNFVLNFS